MPAGHRATVQRLAARPNRDRPAAAPRVRRSRAETTARIAELRAQHPGITQERIAAALGCTPRWVRECAATA